MEGDILLISINITGINKKQKEIIHLIKKYKPDFFLLRETNIQNDWQASKITSQLGLSNSVFNLAIHKVGSGTAILQTSDKWQITDTHRK